MLEGTIVYFLTALYDLVTSRMSMYSLKSEQHYVPLAIRFYFVSVNALRCK